MLTDKELYEFSSYHNAKNLIMDFASIKRIAESDIRDILKIKKSDISIKPMWVSFCSCGTDVEVLEPQWLKQEIINKIEQIINFYK